MRGGDAEGGGGDATFDMAAALLAAPLSGGPTFAAEKLPLRGRGGSELERKPAALALQGVHVQLWPALLMRGGESGGLVGAGAACVAAGSGPLPLLPPAPPPRPLPQLDALLPPSAVGALRVLEALAEGVRDAVAACPFRLSTVRTLGRLSGMASVPPGGVVPGRGGDAEIAGARVAGYYLARAMLRVGVHFDPHGAPPDTVPLPYPLLSHLAPPALLAAAEAAAVDAVGARVGGGPPPWLLALAAGGARALLPLSLRAALLVSCAAPLARALAGVDERAAALKVLAGLRNVGAVVSSTDEMGRRTTRILAPEAPVTARLVAAARLRWAGAGGSSGSAAAVAAVSTAGGGGGGRGGGYEEQPLGVLLKDRVAVGRGGALLDDADRFLAAHTRGVSGGAEMAVTFQGDKGAGEGVTREFFGLLAGAFAGRRGGGEAHPPPPGLLWHHDGAPDAPFASHAAGFFFAPAAVVVDAQRPHQHARWTPLLGRTLGKALADGFLLPLPLSASFFEAVEEALACEARGAREDLRQAALACEAPPQPPAAVAIIRAVLTHGRLRRVFVSFFPALAAKLLPAAEAALAARARGGAAAAADAGGVGEWGLTFECPSTGADLTRVPLSGEIWCSGGGGAHAPCLAALLAPAPSRDSPVTGATADAFTAALMAWVGAAGVSAAIGGVVAGLRDVVRPVTALLLLSPSEFAATACGSQRVEWDAAALVAHVVLGPGYTRGSAPVAHFIAVLAAFSHEERSDFLRFATGCPFLPPGGLAELNPPLKLLAKMELPPPPADPASAAVDVRSDDGNGGGGGGGGGARGGGAARGRKRGRARGAAEEAPSPPPPPPPPLASPHDRALVSASTCFHQVKLPPYSSQAVMRERLLFSMRASEGLIDLT